MRLFPNPVRPNGQLTIYLDAPVTGELLIQLVDGRGVCVLEKHMELTGFTEELEVELVGARGGLHTLILRSGRLQGRQRLLIQ